MHYLILLLSCWVINGAIKFSINSITHKKAAFSLIGYGGFPSTHTAIVTSMVTFVALTNGTNHPVLAPLIVLLWLVINDATALRKRIEEHAKHLNTLSDDSPHRERIAHNYYEIAGGIAVGFLVGWGFTFLF